MQQTPIYRMAEARKGKMAKAQDPLEDAPDPTEDTPDDDSEDTADDQPEGSNGDWNPKDRREAQKKVTELGQENARLREQLEARLSAQDEDDTEDAQDDEATAPDGRYEQDSWALAESLYGEDAIAAYEAAEKLTRKATTPADWVAAFEAYHRIRSGEGQQEGQADAATPEGKKQSRDRALEPRVDNNRSDPSPDLTQNLEEAVKSGSLDRFTSAAAAALGFGPTKRS